MASKKSASLALFLALNLLIFTLTTACDDGGCGPTPKPTRSLASSAKCTIRSSRFSPCAGVLQGLLNPGLGKPPVKPCCFLVEGLADREAAVCFCTAIKDNVLGINLDVPLSLNLLLGACDKKAPSGFQCT